MAPTTLAVAGSCSAGVDADDGGRALPYAVFPPLFWAALRFGNRAAATALLRSR
jgi:hypothetical protein